MAADAAVTPAQPAVRRAIRCRIGANFAARQWVATGAVTDVVDFPRTSAGSYIIKM